MKKFDTNYLLIFFVFFYLFIYLLLDQQNQIYLNTILLKQLENMMIFFNQFLLLIFNLNKYLYNIRLKYLFIYLFITKSELFSTLFIDWFIYYLMNISEGIIFEIKSSIFFIFMIILFLLSLYYLFIEKLLRYLD